MSSFNCDFLYILEKSYNTYFPKLQIKFVKDTFIKFTKNYIITYNIVIPIFIEQQIKANTVIINLNYI